MPKQACRLAAAQQLKFGAGHGALRQLGLLQGLATMVRNL